MIVTRIEQTVEERQDLTVEVRAEELIQSRVTETQKQEEQRDRNLNGSDL